MTYTVVVGNAVPRFNKDKFPVLEAYWEVDNSCFDFDHPFPVNVPRYFSFDGFCSDVGLRDFFNFIINSTALTGGPQKRVAVGIRKEDADYVTKMLNNFREFPEIHKKSNGCLYKWRKDNNYFYNLEVLIWLENQMQFAVNNFDTPAIQAYE